MACLQLINCEWKTNYNFLQFTNNSGSPTEWNNLLTSLKEVQNLSNSLAQRSSTIVTFDLQLYSRSIQLQLNLDLDDSFAIRWASSMLYLQHLNALENLLMVEDFLLMKKLFFMEVSLQNK